MPVIYLTGAPATGKSTLSRKLREIYPELIVFAYSAELRDHIQHRTHTQDLTEESIRQQSAQVVTPQDVTDVDNKLLDLVHSKRFVQSILIDSHAVTKESYGFRITAFSSEILRKLDPDVIICLYAKGEVICSRISKDPMGRLTVSEFEANLHTELQAQVVVQYGVILGKPVYFLDSERSTRELVDIVSAKARLTS